MNPLKRLITWGDSHNPRWLAILRIILGVFLFSRGVTFLTSIDDFQKLVMASDLHLTNTLLIDVIPWIHIAGGFCIIIGIGTRTAAIVQLPVVIGAIIFVTIPANSPFFSFDTTKAFSLLIALLLVVFFVEGSGTLSVTAYAKQENQETEDMQPPPMI